MTKIIRQENVFIIEQSKFSEDQLKFLYDELKQKFDEPNENGNINMREVSAFKKEMGISENCSSFDVHLFMVFLKDNDVYYEYRMDRFRALNAVSVLSSFRKDINKSGYLLSSAFDWDVSESINWSKLHQDWRMLLKSLE
jgi:hypothetical protein